MDVNDDAGCLNGRGVLAFFASRLAPTGRACFVGGVRGSIETVYISVSSVMAAGGFALTASHLEERQVTKRSIP